MWYDDYQMGFREIVPVARYQLYASGAMDPWEMAVFYQDMLEADVVPVANVEHALHFIRMGLVHFGIRAMQ